MTPFALLIYAAGLSRREASQFLDISENSINKMSRGITSPPDGAVKELRELIVLQMIRSAETLSKIMSEADARGVLPKELYIVKPSTHEEAVGLGWPCIGAWKGYAMHLVIASPVAIDLISLEAAKALNEQDESTVIH